MPNWTTPKQNWNVNDIVTAQDMNTIGENLAYLKQSPARASATITATSTTLTSFTTLKSVNVTTLGGSLLVGFYAPMWHSFSSGIAYLDVSIDGTRKALDGNNGSLQVEMESGKKPHSMTLLIGSVSAGAHTVALEWRSNIQTLYCGVGQFWVVEV